jgi:hypothetical protein
VLHIPTLTPEPTYTAGTANTIHYTGDSDLYYYQVRRASNATCTSNVVDSPWVTANSYAFDSLSHGVQYYYCVRGKYADGVRISAWTASTHSTQDAVNPTAQMDALADTQEGTERSPLV